MENIGNETASVSRETAHQLCVRLGLHINDILVFNRALTHRSYLNEHPGSLEDNERLEFLGDAVLDFVVGAWLYHEYPEMREGELTRMRSSLVQTEQLAEFGRRLELGNALLLGRGEQHSGGRERDAILCDAFEALIGALYLDQGLDAVGNFLAPLLQPAAEQALISYRTDDPKSMFQEYSQSHGHTPPVYVTKSSSGPEHSKVFDVDVLVDGVIYGSGTGHSKQAATKAAAQDALIRLGLV